MSQERRERQQERLGIKTSAWNWRSIAMYTALAAVVLGIAFYFYHRSQHEHDAFARCLTARGAKMYGAWWCPHCVEERKNSPRRLRTLPMSNAASKARRADRRRSARTRTSKGTRPGSFRRRRTRRTRFQSGGIERPHGVPARMTGLTHRLTILVAILAVCGIAVSSVSLQHHYATSKTSFCDIGEAFNCDIVNRSEYSTLLGIPVALIGMLGYAALAGLATVYRARRETPALLFGGAAAGLAFALYLTYIEAHVLECTASCA